MSAEGKIDPDEIGRLFTEHAQELERFLIGVVGDRQLARDAVQISFTKLVESGGPDQPEARKAWLFRVAYNEVLATRRRQKIGNRVQRGLQWLHETTEGAADAPLVREEAVDAVREAIAGLPANQQTVVRLRIYEELTFAEISEQLQIPLGTALSRMRAALAKLREALKHQSPSGGTDDNLTNES